MNTVYLNLYGNQYVPVNRLPFNRYIKLLSIR